MTPHLVIDASVTLAWCFQDEASTTTNQLLDRMATQAAIVPAVWYLEIANVLALAEMKRRITPTQTAEFIALLGSFDLQTDDAPPDHAFTALLPFCRSQRITSYDAAYLELASRRGLPLATLDRQLRSAARAVGVIILSG